MAAAERPAIIVPGIEGSALTNSYPISPATTWSTWVVGASFFVAPDFNSLALSDDANADRDEHVLGRPDSLIEIAYAKLCAGLQSRSDAPAYLFPYDWRYSNEATAKLLVGFVDRLRAKKIPSLPAWDKTFDFACHSMGGLVFRAFLSEWVDAHPGTPPPVGRVAFIATPHRGSLNAAQTLISGEDPLLGGQKEMRKLARTFQSVYELLPLPGSHIMWAERDGAEIDLFQESNWQRNTTTQVPDPNGYDVEQRHLDAAASFLRSLPDPFDPKYGITRDRALVVYGAKPESTLQTVVVGPSPENWYDFDNPRRSTGDDVVLVESAQLPGVASVAILPDDIGYLEHPIERMYANIDLHPFLPALDEVQTVVARFFAGTTGAALLPINLARSTPARFTP